MQLTPQPSKAKCGDGMLSLMGKAAIPAQPPRAAHGSRSAGAAVALEGIRDLPELADS